MSTTAVERDAARRYLEHDHASRLGGKAGQAANRNAQQIDDQHSRARDIALTGTSRELGELPGALRAHQLKARKEAGISTDQAAKIRTEYRTSPPPDDEPKGKPEGEHEGQNPRPNRQQQAASAGRSVASAGSGLLDAAGGTSAGQLITQAFTWAIGLSIGYLLISRIGAAAGLVDGAVNVTRAVVSPHIDPLNPKPAPEKRTAIVLRGGPTPASAVPAALLAGAQAGNQIR